MTVLAQRPVEAPPSASAGGAPGLHLRGITKEFPGIVANDDIDLDIIPGQVLALLGENGAGKSTLMKILYGFYQPTRGSIARGDEVIRIKSPKDGSRAGIGMVFQALTLVPALTVAENIALMLPTLPFVINGKALDARINALSARYGFGISAATPVRELTLGERQKVEILKLLLAEARYLVFDEPTSVLAPQEIDELLGIFRSLRDDGFAVVFITHKLREVLEVADRITVLRKGKVVGTVPVAGATQASLISLMLGTEVEDALMPSVDGPAGDTELMRAFDLDVPDPAERRPLFDISFRLHCGEIVGIAGISGNGQVELGETILGLRKPSAGKITFDGSDITKWSTAHRLKAGAASWVGMVPEDALRSGAVPTMTVLENLVLTERAEFSGPAGLTMKWSAAREVLTSATSRFGFSLPRLQATAGVLSGGNVQRLVIARELAREPKLLICYYPTRGMDVPSANAARNVLLRQRGRGAAVLLISEDLDELLNMSDRIFVMYGGRIVADLIPSETSPAEIGLLMTGAKEGPDGGH